MGNEKRQPFWQRTYAIPPGMGLLLGMAIGAVVATVVAFMPPSYFSYRELWILLGTIPPFFGISGYMLWLLGEPARGERLQKTTRYVALALMLGLLVSFPQVLWELAGKIGPAAVIMFMGFVYSLSMFVVAVGWGIVHLLSHLASLTLKSGKPGSRSSPNGVWDRELDVF
jgi:hypothetical protein